MKLHYETCHRICYVSLAEHISSRLNPELSRQNLMCLLCNTKPASDHGKKYGHTCKDPGTERFFEAHPWPQSLYIQGCLGQFFIPRGKPCSKAE